MTLCIMISRLMYLIVLQFYGANAQVYALRDFHKLPNVLLRKVTGNNL